MEKIEGKVKHDPLTSLISSKNEAIIYFTKRDLLEEKVEPLEALWILPLVIKIVNQQQDEGYWRYPLGKLS